MYGVASLSNVLRVRSGEGGWESGADFRHVFGVGRNSPPAASPAVMDEPAVLADRTAKVVTA